MSNEIKGKAECIRILFKKDDFLIALFKTIKSDTDNPMPKSFSLKGEFVAEQGNEYIVHGLLDEQASKKYDNSYSVISSRKDIDLNTESRESVENFLKNVMTESLYEKLIKLDDPINALETGDYETLTSIDGIGNSKAEKAINLYFSQKDLSSVYIELSEFNITPKAIRKIVTHFKSPELAVKSIKDNPYILTKVDGYGFKKADNIFLNSGGDPNDKRRIVAYVEYMFEQEYDKGNSYVTPSQYIANIGEFLPNASKELLKFAGSHVIDNDDYIYIDDENGKRISSREIYNVELEIAKELDRLLNAESNINLDKGIDEAIKRAEEVNGFAYDEIQVGAIHKMAQENVFMLQGSAGTGKTSTLMGYLNAVVDNGYDYATTALSGKAADNLTRVTGRKGRTIHSLIKAKPGEEPYYNSKCKLPYSVIVVDEISMVNINIFLQLLKAIKTGSKLIVLGDFAQLDSIGVGVMHGMIKNRDIIPTTILKKIHRQAQDSGIITHSISARKGKKPYELELKSGEAIYGVNEDLKYNILNDSLEHNILYEVVDEFKEQIAQYDISDVQILCSTKMSGKTSTYEINQEAQKVYNPFSANNIGIELGYKDNKYHVRVGDKVINTKNNPDTVSPDNKSRPIYNGNTGLVKDLTYDKDGDAQLTIDFDGIGEVIVEGTPIDSIQLGYAITIHKSQGSTIKSVIFALPFHYMLNSKELVYTGMTRASDYLCMITTAKSFKHALRTSSTKTKKTNLQYLIKDNIKENN